jgi:hypothetical protein
VNWNLAVEKNHEALKRILAMLVTMVGMTGESAGNSNSSGGGRQKTLPRHLHRFVLRLLRPAESATRRLIIIAARAGGENSPASSARAKTGAGTQNHLRA